MWNNKKAFFALAVSPRKGKKEIFAKWHIKVKQ